MQFVFTGEEELEEVGNEFTCSGKRGKQRRFMISKATGLASGFGPSRNSDLLAGRNYSRL
jgi:hypothetical protein